MLPAILCYRFLRENILKKSNNLWTMIKKLRAEVITDSESRVKSKIAAIVSYLGYDYLRVLYKQTQVRGRNLS